MSITVDPDRVGDLVSALGSSRFGGHYCDLFSDFLSFDQCTVFAFKSTAAPDAVVLEGKSEQMRTIAQSLAGEYVAGGFEQDPNVRRVHQPDCPTVHCLSAAELTDRVYRLRYYDEPRLAHELVVLGQTGDTLYYSSFYRTNQEAGFCRSEVDRMLGLARLALKALHRHLELLGTAPNASLVAAVDPNDKSPAGERRRRMLAHLKEVLLAEPYSLSPREAEVCAGIVLGYTTLGISLNFGISINTVATHRKRAYRKLGVCSQNELFSRYFQLVNQQQARDILRPRLLGA
jgi:DNA-binding CsgD family transcriptional regulator